MNKIVIVFYSVISLGFSFIFSGCSKTESITMAPLDNSAMVTVSPLPTESYAANPNIKLSTSDPFSRIRYTIDGTLPTLSSGLEYTNEFSLSLSLSPMPIQARTYNKDGVAGPLSSNAYSILPVGFWNLNEGSGLSTADQSGNLYTGTYPAATATVTTPGVTWVAGKTSGFAMQFVHEISNLAAGGSATNARQVAISSASLLNFTDNFTISAWVRPISLTNTGMIFGKDSWPASGYRFYIVATTGFPRLTTLDGTPVSITATTGVAVGVWSHVAVTFSFPNVRFYVNGVSAGVFTTTDTIVNPTAASAHINASYNPEMFVGAIDNMRVYATVLSDSHIAAIYALEI